MRSTVLALALFVSSSCILTGCVVAPDPYYDGYAPRHGVVVAPALPDVVVLYDRPYYYYRGYHYLYDDGRWYYTRNQQERWRELPHSHWPRDTRYQRPSRPYDGYRDRYRPY